MRILKEF